MYWADKIAKEIISSKKYKPYWVDDMKTPSGFAHIGSLRGPLIHSLIFRALKASTKEKVTFTFVFNDFDHADELPPEFKEELGKYMGFPLRKIPSPSKEFNSLGEFLSHDLKKSMEALGVEAEYLSSWDMYQEGKFDGVIREALDSAEKIQDIYEKISGSKKREQRWLPFSPICENCGKVGTTKAFAWDGKEVSYKCEPAMVAWADGCGHEGKVSPFGGTGKLPWKVDWAAHWKVVGVTVEGAGKDHASAGGSYDIAMALCKDVFNYPQPFKLPYEFLLVGGKKMSSSKGLGLKAHDLTKILPPELGRFLFSRWDYREQVEFNPEGTMAIPDLFDEYDRCWRAFVDGDKDLGRIFALAQISKVPVKKDVFLPRFREVSYLLSEGKEKLEEYFDGKKGTKLTSEEKSILDERIRYAKVWLEKFAPEEFRFVIKEEVTKTALPSDFFARLIKLIESSKSPEELEKKIYELIKESKIATKDSFTEIYKVLIGKTHGPKVAWLIWENKEKALEVLRKISK